MFMFVNDTKALKKERQEAAYQYVGKHFWGDQGNAGKNYVSGKNKGRHSPKQPIWADKE